MKYYFSLLLSIFSFSLFAGPEDDLNNWLDSTFIAHEIEWEKAGEEFKLYTANNYEAAQDVDDFLGQLVPLEKKQVNNAFLIDNPDNYPAFKRLSDQSKSLLVALERAVTNLIFRNQLEKSQNSFTHLLIEINYFNHVPLNNMLPRQMRSKMHEFGQYIDDSELFEKIALMLLAKKIFLENTYITTEKLMTALANYPTKDSLQIFTDSIYDYVDEDPHFIGGSVNMNDFIMHNFYYPSLSKEIGEPPSKIYVSFVISKTGKVSNVKLRREVENNIIGKQVLRAIKMMPDWLPALKDGNPVAVRFELPIYIHWS